MKTPYKLSENTFNNLEIDAVKKLLDSNGKILLRFLLFDKKTKMLLEYELALSQLLLKFKTYIQTINTLNILLEILIFQNLHYKL